MFIDTHAHIDMLSDPEKAVKEAFEVGVEKIIIPAVEPCGFEKIIELVEKYPCVYGALGVHPSEAEKYNTTVGKKIIEFARHPKIVAIGEIGLDYKEDDATIAKQKSVFSSQIMLAQSLNLPIIVHNRNAHFDTLTILRKSGAQNVLMHCFSGSVEVAQGFIKEGYKIALGGVVTFKNARVAKNVARNISLEHIMLETDCPYLTPHPFRGEENAPKYIIFTAKEIANLKDISVEEVAKITTRNAVEFFNLENEGDKKNESTI